MEQKSILFPLVAQVFLTLGVWIVLYITRVGALKKKRVHPQALADGKRSDEVLKDVVNPSDNFENQFEMPVLFYLAAILIYILGSADSFYVGCGWFFVAFRVAHSLIHCTYNRIMHRFWAYLLSSFALWIMWFRMAYQLLS